jgi:hypothetical protein
LYVVFDKLKQVLIAALRLGSFTDLVGLVNGLAKNKIDRQKQNK